MRGAGGSAARVLVPVLAVGALVVGLLAPWGLARLDENPCEAGVTTLVNEVQARVTRLSTMTPLEFIRDGPGGASEMATAVQARLDGLGVMGCEPEPTEELLVAEMQRLDGDGVIATAVVNALHANFRGETANVARVIPVATGDDLPGLAVTAPPGSVLELAAGDHHVSEPVVIAQELTITGAGRDETRIVSAAQGAAVVALQNSHPKLTDLTVHHEADETAAVVQIASSAYTLRRLAISGGRQTGDAGGTGLLLDVTEMGPPADDGPDRRQEIHHLIVADNDGGGVVITGAAAPRISSAEIRDNGGCGVCYTGVDGGLLRYSVVRGNAVGLLVTHRAQPRVVGTQVERNGEHGVVVDEDAAPRLTGNRVVDHDEGAIVLSGGSRAVVADNHLAGYTVGIWVEGQAVPHLEGNRLTGGGVAGVAFVDDAGGQALGNQVEGASLGIEVRDRARPELRDNTISASDEAAVVVRGEAQVDASGNLCEGSPFDVVLFDSAAVELSGDGCRIHDER